MKKCPVNMEKFHKTNPFSAKIIDRHELTKPGSTKKTFHLELDLTGADLPFVPGDSVGIYPHNSARAAQRTLSSLGLDEETPIVNPRDAKSYSALSFFQTKVNLFRVTSSLVNALLPFCKQGITIENPGNETLFTLFEKLMPSKEALAHILPFLAPLLPRFYSVASSPLLSPNRLDLTVGVVDFDQGGEKHLGVTSEFLCYTAELENTPIPLYLQKARDFHLPDEKDANLIMIGPGTGVAPFRAFIQERHTREDRGKNWLFFGERQRKYDFLYENFWNEHVAQGNLHLETAFSRDQQEKIYVQHKLLENSKNLWQWIDEGAYLYICGDAKQMAKQVLETLTSITADHGSMSVEKARESLREMKKNHRLLLDIY